MSGTLTPVTPSKASTTGLVVVGTLATLITLISIATYVSAPLESLASENDNTIAGVYAQAPPLIQLAFYTHISGGTTALILGPFQFSRRLRARFTRAHRVTGRVYITAVWLGALAGIAIAPYNSAGLAGLLGFGSLAILWFITATFAYRHARARRLDEHRAWMIRNYSLTFAGVMLRAWLPILIGVYSGATGADLDTAFEWAYVIVPFLCWVPNLIIAEWLVRRRGLPAFPPRRG
jgi:uncharacterized membrane protein